jgi:tRNA(Met) C34 N-acetyltransferase TmcA
MLQITITGNRGEGKSTLAGIICSLLQNKTKYQIWMDSDVKEEVDHIIEASYNKSKMDKRGVHLYIKNDVVDNDPIDYFFPNIDRDKLITTSDFDKKPSNFDIADEIGEAVRNL